jgi:hypothetical protein
MANYSTDSPVILRSEEASKLESDINEVCKKYNIKYLTTTTNQYNNNYNYNTHNSSKLPDPLRQLIGWLEIPTNFKFRVSEGSRHSTMLSFANSLLFRYKFNTNINSDQLKEFFFEVNDKICVPEPLPSKEIQQIWIDSLKNSQEKTSRIKIEGDDKKDASSYKTQLTIPLEYEDDRLLEIVQTFVYDIQKNSVDCQLNSKYKPGTRLIVPINIKQWPDVRKSLKNQCVEKGIDELDTLSLLESLDKNVDRITKHYLENYKSSSNTAILSGAATTTTESAAASSSTVQQKGGKTQQRKLLIMDGTEFLLEKYRFTTIEKINDILVYNNEKGVYEYGGEEIIGKEIERMYGYDITTGIVNEIRDHIIRRTGITKNKFDSDLDIINVENGLLNMRTRELATYSRLLLFNPVTHTI